MEDFNCTAVCRQYLNTKRNIFTCYIINNQCLPTGVMCEADHLPSHGIWDGAYGAGAGVVKSHLPF